ncbi:MAG: hypothetical protein AAFY21_01615 [Cyanobacteria bacterium J06641_2]
MTFQPDNEKLGIYNCNSKNPNEEDLPLISEIEKVSEENRELKKDTERQVNFTEISKNSITPSEFLRIIYPDRDVDSNTIWLRPEKEGDLLLFQDEAK